MEDFKYACDHSHMFLLVRASMLADLSMVGPATWNELYGEGKSQRKASLSFEFEDKLRCSCELHAVTLDVIIPQQIEVHKITTDYKYLSYSVHDTEEFKFFMSSSNSVSNGNNSQPQPALKKIKANNFYCFVNNGAGNQMINVPSPANSSFICTSSSAIRPMTAHVLRPGAPPGAIDIASFSLHINAIVYWSH
ncbi:hypothetical protein Pfo_014506 [Paulownia fortunei]|nr:hypothetical protein Pfo_014506 [Paulownia fortunei]